MQMELSSHANEIELAIQRLFQNKFGVIVVPEDDVAYIKMTTWVMGKEQDPPIIRLFFRLEDGGNKTWRQKLPVWRQFSKQ